MARDSDDDTVVEDETVTESAGDRKRDRAETVEQMIADQAGGLLEERTYPTTSEELAAEYANHEIDLPNETESLGSVFDRLVDERYDSPEEAREALVGELTGEQAGPSEYNDERELSELDDAERDPAAIDDSGPDPR
ncbi:hypothetical protein ACNS7O_12690 [Haloferacaceae archaeon DSL9]